MQDSANLLLGIVIFAAALTLIALFVVRSKQRKKDNSQIDRREMFQPTVEPATERKQIFAFLAKIFAMLRRKKTDLEPEASGPELTQTLEALEAISEIENSGNEEATSETGDSGNEEAASETGDSSNEEEAKFPELIRTSSEEELTKAEADVFKGLGSPEESGETSATEDGGSGESSESGNAVGALFGGGDGSLAGAFKSVKEVDEVREALLARVGAVDLGKLSEEIKSLTSRVKEYIPDEVEA